MLSRNSGIRWTLANITKKGKMLASIACEDIVSHQSVIDQSTVQ